MLLLAVLAYLQRHPIIGLISGYGGFLLAYVEPSIVWLKFLSLILGVILTVLTIYAKWVEIKKNKEK